MRYLASFITLFAFFIVTVITSTKNIIVHIKGFKTYCQKYFYNLYTIIVISYE